MKVLWMMKKNQQNLSSICFNNGDWINSSTFAENSWIVNGIVEVSTITFADVY